MSHVWTSPLDASLGNNYELETSGDSESHETTSVMSLLSQYLFLWNSTIVIYCHCVPDISRLHIHPKHVSVTYGRVNNQYQSHIVEASRPTLTVSGQLGQTRASVLGVADGYTEWSSEMAKNIVVSLGFLRLTTISYSQ